MLEYDFLKAISEYVKIYKGFPLPAIICDRAFAVYWSNNLAKSLYPAFTDTESLAEIMEEQEPAALLERLRLEGSCTITGTSPLSEVNLSLLPILEGFDIIGIILLLIAAPDIPTVGTVLQASKTADALDSGIRTIVGSMFDSMDTMALKADLLQMGWVKSNLNTIGMNGYHILRIVGNISEYAKFQSGGRLPNISALNLCDLLEGLEPAITEIGRSMDIPVAFRLSSEPCVVRADGTLLEVALFNLLHNSFYYTRPENHVSVTVTQLEHHALLIVEDQGVGIPAAQLRHICRPYVSHSNNHRGAGIGLGLALVKAVVKAHSGTMDIQSTPGKGTRVTLKLPLAGARTPLSLWQTDPVRLSNRFSGVYTGLTDAAASPYREE